MRFGQSRGLAQNATALELHGVMAATPMHRMHLPLLAWAHAIYLMMSSSKGISAMKLSEMLGISYPAAWHLGHRVRAMLGEANLILSGVVEIDKMYAGAPPRKRGKSSRNHQWRRR